MFPSISPACVCVHALRGHNTQQMLTPSLLWLHLSSGVHEVVQRFGMFLGASLHLVLCACLWWPSRLLFGKQDLFFFTQLEDEYQHANLNMNLTESESLPRRFVPFCCYYESQDSILFSPKQLNMVCYAKNRWKGEQPFWRALSDGDGVI